MQEMQKLQVQSLGQEESPGIGNGNLLHYLCPGNSMDRRVWQITAHGVAKSWTQPSTMITTKQRK